MDWATLKVVQNGLYNYKAVWSTNNQLRGPIPIKQNDSISQMFQNI